MKKILFATTALVATAGVASAEVALTGTAEMGIYDNGNDDTQFFTDFDIRFTLSGEADNGLTFGATIDLDEAADNKNPGRFELPGKQGGEAIFISYGGATFTMGDTDGAFDARLPEMALAGGSLNDDETVHGGFNHGDGADFTLDDVEAVYTATTVAALEAALDDIGFDLGDFDSWDEIDAALAIGLAGKGLDGYGDGQVARFDYAYNAFTFSLSAEQVADGADAAGIGDTIWGLGASWSGQVSTVDVTAALGYQSLEDVADVTGLAVTGGFSNGISAGLTYSVTDIDGLSDDVTHVGVGFGYEMNAIAVGVNWGQFEFDGEEQSGWGLAASYDLGGGLEARLGYGYTETVTSDDYDTWSLGLNMSF